MTKRRNVLFVVMDQMRADLLHGAFANHVDLPNLRALMGDAVSFRRHYSVTNPCGPSRASILTGKYAMTHRSVRNGTPLPHDTPNLATEVRKAGYLPQLWGYTDIAMDPRTLPAGDPMLRTYEQVMPGFVEALEMRLEESWPWRSHLAAKGYDFGDGYEIFRPKGDRVDSPALYAAEDSDTAFLTDRFLADIRARPAGWFAHLTYIRPHPPLVVPEPFNTMYDPASLPSPRIVRDRASQAASHPFDGPLLEQKGAKDQVVGLSGLKDTPEKVAQLRAIYLALASEVDQHFGRIIAFLKETGQFDNTLIVVMADHGEMLGDHHSWGKMHYYDAAYHTPLIIRDPALKAGFGREIDAPTESVDVTPTILGLLGLDIPDTMDGRSLAPFLRGEAPDDWRDYSYSELDFGDPVDPTFWQTRLGLDSDQTNFAILRGRKHTLVHFNGGLPPILFDHESEGEARNVANDPAASPILLEMTQRLLNHRLTHSEGRFARTMITAEGARRAPRVF